MQAVVDDGTGADGAHGALVPYPESANTCFCCHDCDVTQGHRATTCPWMCVPCSDAAAIIPATGQRKKISFLTCPHKDMNNETHNRARALVLLNQQRKTVAGMPPTYIN